MSAVDFSSISNRMEKIESRDQNIKDKKFDDNGHMVTIGLNFHF